MVKANKMRKIDRLFEIVQLLRGQRLRTAEFIANKLGVSVRTIYRDIQGLMSSGVPIEGERGVGYIIQQPIEMPPLNFTPLELKAIQLGINMVKAIADKEITAAAEEVAVKIQDALPIESKKWQHLPVAHIYFRSDDDTRELLLTLRNALDKKQKISISYQDESQCASIRIIRPLGMEYWGKVWTLTAWCELRKDFRVFRIDRIKTYKITKNIFKDEADKTYQHYLKRYASCVSK